MPSALVTCRQGGSWLEAALAEQAGDLVAQLGVLGSQAGDLGVRGVEAGLE